MEIATIGFTRTSAESFFGRLKKSGAKELWDVRLNNTSQLAGFAKRDDLRYFLERLCGITYRPVPELAPEQSLLDDYRGKRISWDDYARQYVCLITRRGVETSLAAEPGSSIVLLCSEDSAERCHRRLAAEHLCSRWEGATIQHL